MNMPRRSTSPGSRPAGRIALSTTSLMLAAAMLSACTAPPRTGTDAAGTEAASTGAGSTPPALSSPRLVPTSVGRLAVYDAGHAAAGGEVLVLWSSILSDHRIYRAQIQAWRQHHRLIVVDGPGHGASGAAPGPFSMADCGQALAQVLDALGVAQAVVVVGTSWGGLVAGEFALAHPARARALVMLNTPVSTSPTGPGFAERFVTWGARWMHGTALYRDGVARNFFLDATRARGGPVLDDFHDHLRQADGPALAEAVRAVLIDREALAPRLPAIQAPVLFIAGRHDMSYPPDSLRSAAATLPRGQFEVVDSAHVSVVDAPQQTTALIDGFLAALPKPR
jgi:3-oxoadipate enol-lactonase